MTTTAMTGRTEALVERRFQGAAAGLELYSVYLGLRPGLYRTLRADGPLTPDALAGRAALERRYAREWLDQQAVAGFLEVAGPAAPAEARRYALPPARVAVLADAHDPADVAPFAPMLVRIAGALPEVAEATAPEPASRTTATAPTTAAARGRSTGRRSSTTSAAGSRPCPASPSG